VTELATLFGGGNATAVTAWVKGLQAQCAAAYPTNPADGALCDAVAQLEASELMPFLYKQVTTLAYDALGVCSVFIAVCTQPANTDPTGVAPEQVHLALTGDLSQMSVAWVTLNASASVVQWGPQPAGGSCAGAPLPSSAAGFDRTYTQGGWLGVVHVATMTGLARGADYCYRVGGVNSAGVEGWSAPIGFSTVPADAGSAASPLRLIQTGDMGYAHNSDTTVASLTALAQLAPGAGGRPHVWLHTGDTSYDDGASCRTAVRRSAAAWPAGALASAISFRQLSRPSRVHARSPAAPHPPRTPAAGYANHFDMFMRKVQPIASVIPMLVVPGNHE